MKLVDTNALHVIYTLALGEVEAELGYELANPNDVTQERVSQMEIDVEAVISIGKEFGYDMDTVTESWEKVKKLALLQQCQSNALAMLGMR